MLTATVIGSVWATRRLAGLPSGAFLEVQAEGSGQRLIAFDFSDVIEDVTDAHAVIINRNRAGSMIIPGDTLGVSEVTPALFAVAGREQ
jgi:hypothetical protein